MLKTYFIRTICLAFLLLTGFKSLFSQVEFPLPVSGFENPFSGGLNAPQFSNIDLNRDGIKDLAVFDRQGDVLLTYLRMPASGRWVVQNEYVPSFPALTDWLLVRDYDGDGVEDLFTSSVEVGVAGIRVFKGSYTEGQWSFTEKKDRGQHYLQIVSGGNLTNLYASWDDIPALVDVDQDGDIDVLSFDPGGSYIAYYKNISVESGWGNDSLRFEISDQCWGKVLESEFSEAVFISDNQNVCAMGGFTDDPPITPRHAGSTIMTLDVDFDGDQDAFVGDITSRRLVFLHNGLNPQKAWITEQQTHFPMDNVPVDQPYFNAAYSVEIDDDPEPELVVAVNSRALASDRNSVLRYDDDPFTDGPLEYQFTENDFLQGDMIDLGSFSKPAISDVTGDGLPDIIVGGYKYVETAETRLPSLWLYTNVGTSVFPSFQLTDEDYLNMSQFGVLPTFDFAPAFGDIDANGTIDLIVGEQNGKLFFYKNNALPDSPPLFESPVYPYMNIAVGVSATPQIIDINNDGLADLVVGERTGNSDGGGRCSNLNYFQNIGVEGNASFNSDANVSPNTQCFGRVLFPYPPGLSQFSAPSFFKTPEGWKLMLGADGGNLFLYEGVENGVTNPLTLVEDNFENIQTGIRSTPAVYDLNDDGIFEVIVGNQRGGLQVFATTLMEGTTEVVQVHEGEKPLLQTIEIGRIYFLPNTSPDGNWRVYDSTGKAIGINISFPSNGIQFDLTQLPAGMYWVQRIEDDRSDVWRMVRF